MVVRVCYCRPWLVQPRGGVDRRAAVGVDLEVQVRPGGVAGVAGQADDVAGGDFWPTSTSIWLMWPYTETVPSQYSISTLLP